MINYPLSDDQIAAIARQEIDNALAYDKSQLSQKRQTAIEYMRGEMNDWPAEKGRSSITSRDTSDTIAWILPGIIRLFTASNTMAIAEPVTPRDEPWARQATDGINYAFWKDNDGYQILYDATWDSLLHGNGVIKHWWDDRPKITTSFHSGLTDDQLAALLTPEEEGGDEQIELLAQETKLYEAPGEIDPQTGQPGPNVQIPLHDVKIKRECKYGQIGLACIAPEDFLISSEAIAIKGARMKGMKQQITRSELIKMGFDPEIVAGINRTQDDDAVDIARRDFQRFETAATQDLEEVTLYELYIQLDVDGDGIAETVQVFMGAPSTVLDWQVWEDEDMFSDIPCDPVPHRWDANSVYDKTKDVQEIKTVLSRQALDNLYATNNPQRFVTGRVINPDELANPSFGGSIFAEDGATVTPLTVPFVADKAFNGIEYFDSVIEKRTGVSRQSMALDPEALQNQTATSAQLAHDSAYSQTELLARNQAELGWKRVFKAVLKLMIRHQDRKRTIRITDEKWVEIDPRYWNAEMDITINTGLGTGSRDRDMAMLSSVKNDQVALAQIFREAGMIDKAVGMIPMMVTTMKKMAEAAGIKVPEQFYPDVTDQEVNQALQGIAASAGKPGPAEQAALQIESGRAQTQVQIKQMDAQLTAQLEQQKSDAQVKREAAQLEADLRTKAEDRQNQIILAAQQQRFEAEQKALDRELQWQIELLKVGATQAATTATTEASLQEKTAAAKAKQAEMMIQAGMTPPAEGIVPSDMLRHMEQLVAAVTAPKRRTPVRGKDGRIAYVDEQPLGNGAAQ